MDLSKAISIIYYTINFINLFSLFGSILSFIVFSRKAFSRSSIRVYCKLLAIFDQFTIFNMIFSFVTWFTNKGLVNDYEFICKFVYFISVGISGIPGWIQAVFSIDLFFKISLSKRFKFTNKSWFQYLVVFLIVMIHCAIYTEIIFEAGLRNATIWSNSSGSWCDLNPNSVLPIVYLIEGSVIPFVIMLVMTILILRSLYDVRSKVSLADFDSGPNTVWATRYQRYRDFKFAFNSVILNLVFILFTMPLVIYYLVQIDDYVLSQLLNAIGYLLFYLNFASHFLIFFSFNSLFRQEFLKMLRIRKS